MCCFRFSSFFLQSAAISFNVETWQFQSNHCLKEKERKQTNNREHVMQKKQSNFHWCAVGSVFVIEVRAASMIINHLARAKQAKDT